MVPAEPVLPPNTAAEDELQPSMVQAEVDLDPRRPLANAEAARRMSAGSKPAPRTPAKV
jgi:hypothetical protein